ncbi:MAG: RtcB family protein, partial [Anaerolineae bacterium]
MAEHGFIKLTPYLYEAPADLRSDMLVPARLYADEALFRQAASDRSLTQLLNTATLPGIVGYALAMPDIHEGYGFPIGGVVATSWEHGVVSPGGVGYDINCGVRLLTSRMSAHDVQPFLEAWLRMLYQVIPSGVGEKGELQLNQTDLKHVLEQGSEWTLHRGLASPADLLHTEDAGRLEGADAGALSSRARERGLGQLGTLGSGNHFLEIDQVAKIYDQAAAAAFGLFKGQVVVWIHSGSRGLGHQVCTDAVSAMQKSILKSGIKLADRELAYTPVKSPEGRQYWAAMNAAANYAWANRQVMMLRVRESLIRILGHAAGSAELTLLYDVCHNIAKREVHQFEGRKVELCVHRKGATRAFGPGQPQLPDDFRALGQPVLVPGSMCTGSFICLGTQTA